MNELPTIKDLLVLEEACNRAVEGEYIVSEPSEPKNWLLAYERLRAYQARIDEHFAAYLVTDKAYTLLQSNPSFRNAEIAFGNYVKKGKLRALDTPSRAFMQLLQAIALHLVLLLNYKSSLDSRLRPTKQGAIKAIKAIDDLIGMERDGLAPLSGWFDMKKALLVFRSSLQNTVPAGKYRARKSDGKDFERHFIECVIDNFLVNFQDPLRNVVLNLSSLVGYSENNSVIDDRIRERRLAAKARQRRALISKLREPSPFRPPR